MIKDFHTSQRTRLIAYIESALLNCEPHSSAFALRILGEPYRVEISNLPLPTDFFCKTHYGGYPEVASIGYAFGCSSDISQEEILGFLDGIKRLINRSEKSTKLISGDDIAILGIADGIRKVKLLNKENFIEIENWFTNIIEQRRNKNSWSFRLKELALDLLDNSGRLRVSFDVSHISTIASEIAIRYVWSQQFLGIENFNDEILNNFIKEILISDITNITDFEESVVWLKAIDEVLKYEIIK